MQGTIQNPATQNGQGVILGDDGITYAYTMLGWRDATATASPGMRVDFDTRGSHAVAIYPVPDALRPLGNTMSPPMAPQPPSAAPASGGYTSPRQPSPIPTTGHVGASPNAPGQPAHATGHATSSPFVPRQPTHIPTTGHVSSSPISPGQPTRTPMAGHVGAAPATAGQMANFPTAGQAASPPIAAGPGAQHPAAPAGVPGTAAPSLPAQRSRTKLFIAAAAAILAASVLAVGAFWFLQQPRSDEEIAAQVARDWTDSSIDDISEMAMGLVVGNAPVVANLGASVLSERIRESVAWSYSEPSCPREGRCDMRATANANFDIYIPLLLDETVTVKMPFDLYIDTEERQVANWAPDIRSASVSGIELGVMSGVAEAAIATSSDDIMRAVGKIRQFADDEGYQGVFDDASDAWDSFVDEDAWESLAEEFDMDSTIDDVSETWGNLADEYELESAIDDLSDRFSSDGDIGSAIDDVSDRFSSDGDVGSAIDDVSDRFSSDGDVGSAIDDVSESLGGIFGN